MKESLRRSELQPAEGLKAAEPLDATATLSERGTQASAGQATYYLSHKASHLGSDSSYSLGQNFNRPIEATKKLVDSAIKFVIVNCIILLQPWPSIAICTKLWPYYGKSPRQGVQSKERAAKVAEKTKRWLWHRIGGIQSRTLASGWSPSGVGGMV